MNGNIKDVIVFFIVKFILTFFILYIFLWIIDQLKENRQD